MTKTTFVTIDDFSQDYNLKYVVDGFDIWVIGCMNIDASHIEGHIDLLLRTSLEGLYDYVANDNALGLI